MSVALRLTRAGAKKAPYYRIVAADKRSPRDGRYIEQIGTYDPLRTNIHFDFERVDHWLSCGAQPSDTVRGLIKTARKAEQAAS